MAATSSSRSILFLTSISILLSSTLDALSLGPNAASMNNPTVAAKQQMLGLLDGIPESIYVCPESLAPLSLVYRYFGFSEKQYLQSQEDSTIKYDIFPGKYVDLTIKTGTPSFAIGETFFQNKLLPTIYERGYRQNFENMGFPGIDKEFGEVDEFFKAGNAQTILDLSCGSGFMTRRFVSSKNYARVIAGDLSPNMLEETRRRCLEEGLPVPELVRCDSSRLPFATGSLDAVHAGAAMHCWPRLSEALAEIYRVLKPGGLYFASTFFIGDLKKIPTGNQFSTFASTEELDGYVTKAGFSNSGGATVVRKEGGGCAIIKAIKAPIPEKGSAGLLSELFNDTFQKSSGESGEQRLTIDEAKAVSEGKSVDVAVAPVLADIVDTAVAAGSFKTLSAALDACGLVDTLKYNPFTVFAPTDEAFAKLPAGTVDALLADIPKLTAILTYHVVPGTVMAETVVTLNGQKVKTVNGAEVTITVDADGVKVSYLYH
jgi:uncharacterized surface protein with fasciclin (FAS1) repeats